MNLKQVVKSYGVLNIVGYLRKSRQDIEREKRTGEDTLSEQRELMNRTLTSIELPYDLKMEVVSGENIEGRPVFQEVLKDLEKGTYQAIAVKELSRLSRGNMGDAQRILDTIKDNRLIIITPFKVYDVRNTMDMKQIRFELFLAREEYEMIKERMVGARYMYASQGKWVAGAAPYGFSYDKKTQKLQIKDEEAKTVRIIYDLFLNGLNGSEVSFQAIATHLTRIGIPTPRGKKTWSYVQVRKILTNDLYEGTIRFRTTEEIKKGKKTPRPESEHIIVEDAHEKIIEKDIWESVQQKVITKLPLPHNPLDFDPCELASICNCSECDGKLIRNCGKRIYTKQDGSKSEYVKEFLKCQRNGCMSVKYRDVEYAILTYFKKLQNLDDKVLTNHLTSIASERSKDNQSETNEQILEQIKQKELELDKRMAFIYDKYEKEIYTDEMFLDRKKAIDEERIELLKGKKQLINNVSEIGEFDLTKFRSDIAHLLEAYHSMKDKKRKNKLLRTIIEKVIVKIIVKGTGRTPAKFEITPYLRYDLYARTLIH